MHSAIFFLGVAYGIGALIAFVLFIFTTGLTIGGEREDLYSKDIDVPELLVRTLQLLGFFRILVWAALALFWPPFFAVSVILLFFHLDGGALPDPVSRALFWAFSGFGKFAR